MTIKNTKLGGADFNTPSDRVKPTDLNDTFDVVGDVVLKALGSLFNDTMQNLFNADYLGFSAKLHNSGIPNLDNVFYSTFQTEDAETNEGFLYDSTNDLYELPDLSSGLTEYIIVEATSLSASWNANDVRTIEFATGKWLVWCTTGTDAVRRAQIHKSLWYGTDGTDALMDDFTSVTTVKTSHANDVDKRATLVNFLAGLNNGSLNYTGTFADTSTNNDCSVWSKVRGEWIGAQGGTLTVRTEFASGNTINTIDVSGNSTGEVDELGTDRAADELTNPADIQIECALPGAGGLTEIANLVILHEGTISWVETGTQTTTEKDYTTDDSIPVMTAAGSLAAEGVGLINTLIFKDTASSSVENMIPVINSIIDATSSQQISVSANSGGAYTNVENAELVRPTAGTGVWRRIVITRTDLSKIDKVTEQAVKNNIY